LAQQQRRSLKHPARQFNVFAAYVQLWNSSQDHQDSQHFQLLELLSEQADNKHAGTAATQHAFQYDPSYDALRLLLEVVQWL